MAQLVPESIPLALQLPTHTKPATSHCTPTLLLLGPEGSHLNCRLNCLADSSLAVVLPAVQGGDEVDQTSREPLLPVEPPPTQESPAEGTAEHDQQQDYHHHQHHHLRCRLRFGQPSWPTVTAHTSTLAAAAAVLLLLLLLAGQLAQRYRGRQAAAQVETQTQLGALLKTATQHAQQLQAVQHTQGQVSRTLAALSAAVQEVQAGAATEGEKVGAAVASVQERLAALETEVRQQGSLLQQLQRLQHQQQEAVAGGSRPAAPPMQLGLSAEQVAGVVQAEVQRALSLFEADRTVSMVEEGRNANSRWPASDSVFMADIICIYLVLTPP